MSKPRRFCLDFEDSLTVAELLEEIVVAMDRIGSRAADENGVAGLLFETYLVERNLSHRLVEARRVMRTVLDRELGEAEVASLIEQRLRLPPN